MILGCKEVFDKLRASRGSKPMNSTLRPHIFGAAHKLGSQVFVCGIKEQVMGFVKIMPYVIKLFLPLD